jgi:hypothetical protein
VYRKEYLHPDFSFIPFNACSIPFNACYLGRRKKKLFQACYLYVEERKGKQKTLPCMLFTGRRKRKGKENKTNSCARETIFIGYDYEVDNSQIYIFFKLYSTT